MKQSFWAAFAARFLLILLLLVVFVAAVFIAGASLHDPDTCWLLALGKRIFESGSLPAADPYSYTMEIFPGKHFVLYQWLTEVLFFLSYKAFDLMGLLLLAAIVLTSAFVSLPLALARKVGMPGTFAVFGTILTLLTAFFHFLCRPEIFSYLLLGVYISLTHFFLRNRNMQRIDWKAVTIFGAVMALWCNLHSGFVLGLLYLFVFALVTSVADFIVDKRLSATNQTIILSFLAGFLGSFINPYGSGLWQYLPTLFFTPINKHILELRPLGGKDFLEWTYHPFLILVATALSFCVMALSRKVALPALNTPRGQVVFAAIAVVCWTIAGINCRRLIPFAAVHLFCEGGYMLALLSAQRKAEPAHSTSEIPEAEGAQLAQKIEDGEVDDKQPFLEQVDRRLDSSYHPRGLMWFVTIAVLAAVGVYFVTSRISAPVLPQSSAVMQAPFDAIRFISEHPPAGRLFNEPQFGDVMIWKMADPPKLFIDTRFDMYGKDIVEDFQTIYCVLPGWEDLMRRYKITWIFVRPEAAIAKHLLSDQHWKVLYQDKASIVIASQN